MTRGLYTIVPNTKCEGTLSWLRVKRTILKDKTVQEDNLYEKKWRRKLSLGLGLQNHDHCYSICSCRASCMKIITPFKAVLM
jgi:hypothetical protein